MAKLFPVLFILLFTSLPGIKGQAGRVQIPAEMTGGIQIETRSPFYNAAYLEIRDMLEEKIPLSIKRAVFLAEWAYLDGELDYDDYCQSIEEAVTFLNKFIAANGLGQYKTGKNMALIEYFSGRIRVTVSSLSHTTSPKHRRKKILPSNL